MSDGLRETKVMVWNVSISDFILIYLIYLIYLFY